MAEKFNKSKWGYAILGVVAYYAGLYISLFLIGMGMGLFVPEKIDSINETLFGLLGVPFGLLASHLLYKFFKKQWNGGFRTVDASILDDDRI